MTNKGEFNPPFTDNDIRVETTWDGRKYWVLSSSMFRHLVKRSKVRSKRKRIQNKAVRKLLTKIMSNFLDSEEGTP